MPRRGRKRKEGPREPSGRLKTPTRIERAEDATNVVVLARMRLFGMSKEDARSDLAGSEIGRMLQRGELTRDEHEACQRYHAIRTAYVRSLHGPAGANGVNLTREPRGADNADTSDRDIAAERAWNDVSRVLAPDGRMIFDPPIHKVVADTIMRDIPLGTSAQRHAAWRCGILALVRLWRLPNQEKAVG